MTIIPKCFARLARVENAMPVKELNFRQFYGARGAVQSIVPVLAIPAHKQIGRLLSVCHFTTVRAAPTKSVADARRRRAFSPDPSTCGVVNITQDARLKLQILQSMLDDIPDADDTG